MSITLCRDATMQQGAAAAPFSPDQVAGLEMWLKADAITGLNDGDPVTTWEDSHTSNNDATQATASRKPTYKTAILNGLPVLRFDGTDDSMDVTTLDLVQGDTIFVVAQVSNTTGIKTLIDGINASGRHIIRLGSGTAWELYAGTIISGGVEDTNWHVFTGIFNGASSSLRLNGTQVVSGNAGAQNVTSGIRIGVNQDNTSGDHQGDIAEILAYDEVLSATDYEAVERYLRAKWAIPAILRPNADITHNWAITDGGSTQGWQVLDDAVVEPSAPGTGSDYIRNDAASEVEEVALTTATVGTVTEAKVWYYASSGVIATNTTIALYKGGTQIASGTLAGNSSAAWRSVTYTGSLTQSEVDDLRIRFTAPATDVATVYAAYVALTHTS